jgi:hypothetical protein
METPLSWKPEPYLVHGVGRGGVKGLGGGGGEPLAEKALLHRRERR